MKRNVAFGWLVQVGCGNDDRDNEPIQYFNVAEPNKIEAVKSVRRRVAGAERATITALECLSRHTVLNVLRLKRGEMMHVV